VKRGLLIVVSGPSGVGKDTLIKRLLELDHNLIYSISGTTREPRPGEIPDENYTFLTREQFEDLVKQGAFLEHAVYNGNLYGTFHDRVERARREGRDVVLKIEVQGAEQVKQRVPDALRIFIGPPSWNELAKRQEERGSGTKSDRNARLEIAEKEMTYAPGYDHLVVNDDVERAAHELLEIIRKARERQT
jgi:guanylate kinase